MKYTVQLEGFENQAIEVDPPGLFTSANIFINGSPASTKKNGEFILKRNDGVDVIAKVKPSFFYDAPSLQIEGKTIHILEPLAWYQYLLSSVPVIWAIGGLVAALIGIGLIVANIRIFRSKMNQLPKYLLVLFISFVLPVLYMMFLVSIMGS
ncbi:MAG: hypothetical protein L6461_19910 [Anaerolineae bacterium]|nr:hypothetical protein [Anaerolineae bacterium]